MVWLIMVIEHLTLIGGIFSIFVFWHFVSDWVFQTHQEAMTKSKDFKVRLRHCVIYTLFFAIPFFVISHSLLTCLFALYLLCASHLWIDTYVPTLLWMKYLRKHPEFNKIVASEENGVTTLSRRAPEDAFKEIAKTPLGIILIITIDQLLHISVLFFVTCLIIFT